MSILTPQGIEDLLVELDQTRDYKWHAEQRLEVVSNRLDDLREAISALKVIESFLDDVQERARNVVDLFEQEEREIQDKLNHGAD